MRRPGDSRARGPTASRRVGMVPRGAAAALGRLARAPGGHGLVALAAVVAGTTLLGALALGGAALDARAMARRAPPIELPPPPALPEVSYRRADETPGDGEAPACPAFDRSIPEVRWRDAAKLRRAAGLVLLDGDCDAAFDLLMQVDAGSARAVGALRGAGAKAVDALLPALLAERDALRALFAGLDAEAQSALFGPAEDALRDEFPRFLACRAGDLTLPACPQAIPERLLMTFLCNVHVRLREASGADDALVGLLVGLGLPAGSPLEALYRERAPARAEPYPIAPEGERIHGRDR